MPIVTSSGPAERKGGSSRSSRASRLLVPTAIILTGVLLDACDTLPSQRPFVTPEPGQPNLGLSDQEKAIYDEIKTNFRSAADGGKIYGATTKEQQSVNQIIADNLTRLGLAINPDQFNVSYDELSPYWLNFGADRTAFMPITVDFKVEGSDQDTQKIMFMFGKTAGGQWGQVGFFVPESKPDANGKVEEMAIALDVTDGTADIWGMEIASSKDEGFSRQFFFSKAENGAVAVSQHFPGDEKPAQQLVLNNQSLFTFDSPQVSAVDQFKMVSFKMASAGQVYFTDQGQVLPELQTPEGPTQAGPTQEVQTTLPKQVQDALKTEEEIREILASIEEGSIEYVDYGLGSITEAQIDLESFKAQETADWYFDAIVTAQAKDKDGKEFKVVWNKDENHWVRAERTHFKNIDQMVETGDYNLVLLTQPGYGEPFPEGTEKAQYMIGIAGSYGLEVNGKAVSDTFLKLVAVREDSDFDVASTTLMHSRLREAGFHKGVAPQKTHDEDFGTTANGKEIVLIPIEIQNGNGKNVIIPAGLDPLLYNYFKNSIDAQGLTDFQNALTGNRVRFTPVFPTDNPDDWNNFQKNGIGNGSMHIPDIRDFGFNNNVIITLLEGNEKIFVSLPEDLKMAINKSLTELRRGGDPQMFFPFDGGMIPDEFAGALSRNITEATLTSGFLEPAK